MADAADGCTSLRMWDLSSGVGLNSAEVKKIAEYGKVVFIEHSESRVAVVAPSDLAFGIVRMESVYRDDLPDFANRNVTRHLSQ